MLAFERAYVNADGLAVWCARGPSRSKGPCPKARLARHPCENCPGRRRVRLQSVSQLTRRAPRGRPLETIIAQAMAMVLRWWSPSLVAAALVLGASIPAAAPGGGWPVPNWTTVPTYTFCGPGKRLFNEAELAFISGKSSAGYAPRWMALGYSTLAQYPPVQQASCAKQTEVARHIKAV
eukprot:COSAG06_NODE_3215_length_5667_cov_5.493355_1_plen_178_part_10